MVADILSSARLAVQRADTGLDGDAWLIHLTGRCRVVVAGRHRARFLHNFTTCQVKDLPVNTARWGAITNEHGGVVAVALIEAHEDQLVCEVEHALRDEVIAHLTRYRIADQVTFTPEADNRLLSVCGPHTPEVIGAVGLPWLSDDGAFAQVDFKGGPVQLTRNDYRWDVCGVDLSVPSDRVDDIAAALLNAGAGTADSARLTHHRVAHGIPVDRVDVDPETTPLEVAYLRPIVDWNKGCYLGQEVICMMEDLGKPRKQLTEVVVSGTSGSTPSDLANPAGKPVGRLTTTISVGDTVYGLATLKRKYAKPGTEVHIGADGVATVVGLAGAAT